MADVNAKDLHKKLKDYLKKCIIVDIRSPEEYEEEHIDGAINIPLETLVDNIGKLDKKKQIIAVCLTGLRSKRAVNILTLKGFNAGIVEGGMIEWRRALGPAYFAAMAGEGEGE
ncbi:MAG: rhodanese-like domain-containing protein [Candidatus Aenigmarchaeota archaeon]|nr:rhodanese-like domain-containing protein [Candidatus Aenigmarchaeota archaeon]